MIDIIKSDRNTGHIEHRKAAAKLKYAQDDFGLQQSSSLIAIKDGRYYPVIVLRGDDMRYAVELASRHIIVTN